VPLTNYKLRSDSDTIDKMATLAGVDCDSPVQWTPLERTLEGNMVDGLIFFATLTGCKRGHISEMSGL